ncbi:MAG TPA: TIGR01777 family oxidoreductase [Gaiellaceae bacterium]|nr:TIGR01777 family oxidoreductase [Gaiellaceae bacterium]
MKVVVSGASGLIGSMLVPTLRAAGHDVIRLVRRDAAAPDEVRWDPSAGELDTSKLDGAEAFVNLSGANLDQRWTADAKREILESRTKTTSLLATTARDLGAATLLCAGGSGIYGNREDEILTETSESGGGFLADVMRETEAASQPARDAGVRVVHFRQGIVLSREGGALHRMLPFFRLGVGGPVGDGRQWWSWVSRPDVVAAYGFALENDISGAVNVTSPNPVTSKQFAKALGRAIKRPAVLPVPGFAVKLVFGHKGEEVLLFGQRALPARLLDAGFEFSEPTIDAGMARALAD